MGVLTVESVRGGGGGGGWKLTGIYLSEREQIKGSLT